MMKDAHTAGQRKYNYLIYNITSVNFHYSCILCGIHKDKQQQHHQQQNKNEQTKMNIQSKRIS